MKEATPIFLRLLVIALALLFGLALWQGERFTSNLQILSQTIPESPNLIVPQTPHDIDISDWKTYRNEEYGFEVRYPPTWNQSPDPDYQAYPYNEYPHLRPKASELTVIFAEYDEKSREQKGIFMLVSRNANPDELSLDDFIKLHYTDSATGPQYSSYGNIGGVPAVNMNHSGVLFVRGKDGFQISRSLIFVGEPLEDNLFEQILSTFKFTK